MCAEDGITVQTGNPPGRREGPGGESEAISNSTSIAGGDKSKGTATDTVHGGDLAAEAANPSHLEAFVADIEAKASGGRFVCACSVYPLSKDLGASDSPNVVGAAFRVASLHGTSAPIGYHRATRRARQSGVHALWIGANA